VYTTHLWMYTIFSTDTYIQYSQGCQMVDFQNQTPNFGKFWKAFEWKFLIFWWPFDILCGHLLYCMAIRYIFGSFVIFPPFRSKMYHEKTGNPAAAATHSALHIYVNCIMDWIPKTLWPQFRQRLIFLAFVSRWQPTRAPSPWEGILQATTPGPVCPQKLPGTNVLKKIPRTPLGDF
jgi:hypothetical protein